MDFVAYYRVSTQEQGKSGLSLSSQKDHVRKYIKAMDGNLIDEFQEVESGGKVDRVQLMEAIDLADEMGATLIVKKIDRLTRDGFKISQVLEDRDIPYMSVESPHDGDFIKNIKLAVAKDERQKISQRITDAFEEIKKEIAQNGFYVTKGGKTITSLGKPENLGGEKAIENSKITRRNRALTNPNNIRARAVIDMMYKNGHTFYGITKFLNENSFQTSRGNKFSQVQVKNLCRVVKEEKN